ncbi:hypothetical protein I7I53_10479 [Histoplasma capsulatum var. duboisii H88]|uniref:Uncharacterized protein n=1 Tax=Ajellomyces capsulatus (strain H88) TaxID=544711 RepID=A0A8A1LBA3_AJEC8|nr:hypothetical protein I7I53_10479 [Histoplasma capsulatum var. duboisii H88]
MTDLSSSLPVVPTQRLLKAMVVAISGLSPVPRSCRTKSRSSQAFEMAARSWTCMTVPRSHSPDSNRSRNLGWDQKRHVKANAPQ